MTLRILLVSAIALCLFASCSSTCDSEDVVCIEAKIVPCESADPDCCTVEEQAECTGDIAECCQEDPADCCQAK